MIFNRKRYLDKLIQKKNNGMVKIITGIRRCGKSFLLTELFHKHLNSVGIPDQQIIELALDEDQNIRYRNPILLGEHIRELVSDKNKSFYVILDEIQKVKSVKNPYLPDSDDRVGFVDVLLGLMKLKNVDVYVTGSNSKMLSSDIVTEFRGRGDELRLYPLSYQEILEVYNNDTSRAWKNYVTYGGMPKVLLLDSHEEKSQYLKDLFSKIYITDILERHGVRNDASLLEELIKVVASSIGSLTNPTKLANTFASKENIRVSHNTIADYLDYFVDAFLINKAYRYDIKGKSYIDSPLKYYFADIGVRNARLDFRQQEETHIMENIIYNHLLMNGYEVDVGSVEVWQKDDSGKRRHASYEVDFVARKAGEICYIQSALSVADEEKRLQEINSLINIKDSFSKIVVVKDNINPWRDNHGIQYLSLEQFLTS